ncbi:MAG: 4-alpha-glucanotransferase [Ignavibacteriales bacterium]|nr:4-alpha-glucanotransferase [Ignavibacteriales bacterium]
MRFSRRSGILLHPTSLPGPYGAGDLGFSSYHFVDWLVTAGQSLWQVLPLGPVGMANSPYMSLSAFAGSPLLIDLDELVRRGWLDANHLQQCPDFPTHRVDYENVVSFRIERLREAAERFAQKGSSADKAQYELFCREHASWLNDYSLFQALNDRHHGALWSQWEKELVSRKATALRKAAKELGAGIEFHKFTQWCFYEQWKLLRKYANERGVKLVGDIPIFVAHHSSDVWANPHEFHLDAHGNPTRVAGVPPDYFSETGQRWGNPLYRWDVMKEERYAWWVERFRASFELFDFVRIDHFRGFAACWQIPSSEKTAVKGKWVNGPGGDLFKAVEKKLGKLAIIAEDLGLITPDVVELRNKFEFPGMKVLQFAFANGPEDVFLPHNYVPNCVVYTGTHDNDTTRGWYEKATERERDHVRRYLTVSGDEIHWDLIRAASRSVADMCVVPMQDVLGLGSEHRMNLPGTTKNNWEWRFAWDWAKPYHADTLYEITALNNRCKPDRLSLPLYPSNMTKP